MLAQTSDLSEKDAAFKQLDEVLVMAGDNPKIPAIEKMHVKMQVNNIKKNIHYRRDEKREAIPLLMDQLKIIGDNEATFGMSLVHVTQDLALVHVEIQEYEQAIHYAEQLEDYARKTATRNHNVHGLLELSGKIKKDATHALELAAMNPINRLRKKQPAIFYSVLAIVVGGIGLAAFKLTNRT